MTEDKSVYNKSRMITCKTKKWGNSIGIIIPSDVISELNIKPDEDVSIDISKKNNVLREMFGAIKFSKPTAELLREVRKDMESKFEY